MKPVIYRNDKGYIKRSLIKDKDSETKAPLGIPAGPPDLDQLDWEAIKLEINNQLAEAGIFDWTDLQRRQQDFLGAVNIFKRHLSLLFRVEAESNTKKGISKQ